MFGSPHFRYEFTNEGDYVVELKVVDFYGNYNTTSMRVEVAASDAGSDVFDMPAPEDLAVQRQGSSLSLKWRDAKLADYLLLKLNALPFVYVDAERGELELRDVSFEDLEFVQLAWMDKEFNVGNEASFDMSRLEDKERRAFGALSEDSFGPPLENPKKDTIGVRDLQSDKPVAAMADSSTKVAESQNKAELSSRAMRLVTAKDEVATSYTEPINSQVARRDDLAVVLLVSASGLTAVGLAIVKMKIKGG